MSETDNEQKTEQATDKRQEELRREGKVAHSPDLVSAVTLATVGATLAATMSDIALASEQFAVRSLRLSDASHPERALLASLNVLNAVAPSVAAGMVAALATGLAQTRGLFSLELAIPKLERLDPISHLQQLVPSKQMAMETGKALLKLGTLAFVVKQVLTGALPRLLALGAEDPRVAGSEVAELAVRVAMWGGATFAAVSAVDYWFVQRRFQQDAMMTREEVKEEAKQEEQDPHIKQRARAMARERMAQRRVGDLSTATVLVTNPTHFAVALRYRPDTDAAPMVIAKARDAAALRMRTGARKHGVPIVENRPLARALHKTCKIGRPIPSDLYRAVAEVIAHVMRIRAGVQS